MFFLSSTFCDCWYACFGTFHDIPQVSESLFVFLHFFVSWLGNLNWSILKFIDFFSAYSNMLLSLSSEFLNSVIVLSIWSFYIYVIYLHLLIQSALHICRFRFHIQRWKMFFFNVMLLLMCVLCSEAYNGCMCAEHTHFFLVINP